MKRCADERQWLGLLRSVLIYHGIPFRRRRLTQFYARFIRPGDLCFDIGAHVGSRLRASHVGSRLRAWLPLDARIVAVEPQPSCMALLRRWFSRDGRVTLIEQAVGACSGSGRRLFGHGGVTDQPAHADRHHSFARLDRGGGSGSRLCGRALGKPPAGDGDYPRRIDRPPWYAGVLQDRCRRLRAGSIAGVVATDSGTVF